ncbi:fructose-1-6-bisphosphatase [Emericellopsis atlantica]|uniref:Fructose-1-6-bisphosphatase n=1 Tax=Emericellopsis atlantica TaxID=2614577 RepID=A0A9P7ZJA4_9HYPO|nr:fructose-1-6-bisphosphatase [Emericellopsis atlantica]KAG9253144.1 fructose-1-6-bisphosphatase [Emericellopsis atlantica]
MTSTTQPLEARLHALLPSHPALRTSLLPALLTSFTQIAQTLRTSQRVALAGSANHFGDDQLNVDVSCEKHIRDALEGCPSVVVASSEEDPVEVAVAHAPGAQTGEERYSVAFDPLDGSSIIAPNWTVGTIVGVWAGDTAVGVSSSQQIASLFGVYGPRTTAYMAIRLPGQDDGGVCVELGLNEDNRTWDVLREKVTLTQEPKARYFAPANLRSAAYSEPYMDLIHHFIRERYNLRYCGGLVPDLVHTFVKGHGVYVSPVTARDGPKLRRLYELLPVALLMECAGGRAVDPQDGRDVLDRVVRGTEEKGGLVCGNAEDVEMVMRTLRRG